MPGFPNALLRVGLSLLDYGVGGPRASGAWAIGLRELVVVVVVITVAEWVVVLLSLFLAVALHCWCVVVLFRWHCIMSVLWHCCSGIA